MHPTRYTWQITKLVPHDNNQKSINEFIVAETIHQVLDYIKLDLADESVEVETIAKLFPVVDIITSQKQ